MNVKWPLFSSQKHSVLVLATICGLLLVSSQIFASGYGYGDGDDGERCADIIMLGKAFKSPEGLLPSDDVVIDPKEIDVFYNSLHSAQYGGPDVLIELGHASIKKGGRDFLVRVRLVGTSYEVDGEALRIHDRLDAQGEERRELLDIGDVLDDEAFDLGDFFSGEQDRVADSAAFHGLDDGTPMVEKYLRIEIFDQNITGIHPVQVRQLISYASSGSETVTHAYQETNFETLNSIVNFLEVKHVIERGLKEFGYNDLYVRQRLTNWVDTSRPTASEDEAEVMAEEAKNGFRIDLHGYDRVKFGIVLNTVTKYINGLGDTL